MERAHRTSPCRMNSLSSMSPLRILLLAPDCNPDSISTPQIAYEQARALARLHTVTLVVRAANEQSIRRAGGHFPEIVAIRLPGLDRLYSWALRRIFKYDYGRQSLTAASYPLQIAFEWRAWRQLRRRILSRDFDVVLRILADRHGASESLRVFSPQRSDPLCHWAAQRGPAVARRFPAAGQATTRSRILGLEPQGVVPVPAVRSIDVREGGRDHRRLVTHLRGVRCLSGEAVLRSRRERHRSCPLRRTSPT